MDLDLKGCLKFNAYRPIDFIIHNNRCMTDWEARTVINYGIAKGHKLISEVPDEVADAVCEIGNDTYKEYEPEESLYFIAEKRVREILESRKGEVIDEDLIEEIIESL